MPVSRSILSKVYIPESQIPCFEYTIEESYTNYHTSNILASHLTAQN